MLPSLPGVWAALGQWKADCVPGHQIILDMGVALCCPMSLNCLDTAGGGVVSVVLTYVHIAGWVRLTSHRCRKYPGASPQLSILYIFGLITVCTLFTPPLPQVFPDNARVGTFCSEIISQECYQTGLKRFFSGVDTPPICAENWKITLSATQDCISSPVLPTREMIPYDSCEFTKKCPK